MILVEHVAVPFEEDVDDFVDDAPTMIRLGFRAYWAMDDVVKDCVRKIERMVGYKRPPPPEC